MARSSGTGPFHVMDKIELIWGQHRGQVCNFVHTSAYGQCGELIIELVQQDVEGPSPFRDMYAPGEEGVHHVATIVDSLPETYAYYESLGFDVSAKAQTKSGIEFAFIDTVAALGHMVEVYEASEALLGFYKFIRSTSQGWDGKDPVRSLR